MSLLRRLRFWDKRDVLPKEIEDELNYLADQAIADRDKGQPGGVPSLGSDGLIPLSQLPTTIQTIVHYIPTWPGYPGAPSSPAEEEDPLAAYKISDMDTGGAIEYFGFLDADANWYILALTTTEARYVKGTSGYGTAWTGRVGLSYDTYDNTF